MRLHLHVHVLVLAHDLRESELNRGTRIVRSLFLCCLHHWWTREPLLTLVVVGGHGKGHDDNSLARLVECDVTFTRAL